MITKYARPFILLGERIAETKAIFFLRDSAEPEGPQAQLSPGEKRDLSEALQKIVVLCEDLSLPVSKDVFTKRLENLPENGREFGVLIDLLYSEIKNKLFVFVPQHRRRFFTADTFIDVSIKEAFPAARKELRFSGKCFAVGLYTASVFHAVRAIELGLRAVADNLGVSFSFPLDQASWETLINQIESKIFDIKDRKRSAEKDLDQRFYSQVAMQFRYFKDGWRIRVAHTRETYDESQARGFLEHAVTFFETLSKRLKEPA